MTTRRLDVAGRLAGAARACRARAALAPYVVLALGAYAATCEEPSRAAAREPVAAVESVAHAESVPAVSRVATSRVTGRAAIAEPARADDAAALAWLFDPAGPATRAAECVLPDGPVLASAELAGGVSAVITPGAVRVGARRLTPCDGLPGAHPLAIAAWQGGAAVGFRDGSVHAWGGERFVEMSEIRTRLAGSPVRALASAGGRLYVGTAAGLWVAESGVASAETGADGGVVAPSGVDGDAGSGAAAGAEDAANLLVRQLEHRVLGRRAITALRADAAGGVHVGADPRGWWYIAADGAVSRRGRESVGCFVAARGRVRALPPGGACLSNESHPAIAARSDEDAARARWRGLPSAHVTALAVHAGVLHVGLFDRGLVRLEDEAFAAVPGAPPFVNALLPAGDTLYVATPVGLYAVREGRARRVVLGLPSPHVNGMAMARDGTLWLATGAGLVGWTRAGAAGGTGAQAASAASIRVIDQRAGLPSRLVYAVAEAADGALWAGTAAGAVRLADTGISVYSQATGAVPHDWITALLPDGADGVLAGTYDAGVARLGPDGDAGDAAVVAAFGAAWINPGGLVRLGGRVLAATLGDGLLAAPADGLAAPAPGDGDVSSPGAVVIAPIASGDVTAAIAVGDAVWVGTRGGLVRYSRRPGAR